AEEVDRVCQLLGRMRARMMDVLLVAARDRLAPFGAPLQPGRSQDGLLVEQGAHLVSRTRHPGAIAPPDQLPDLALLVGHHSASGSAARGSPTCARCDAAVKASQIA